MKVEILIYIYITICVSLIAFNCVYVLIMKKAAGRLEKKTKNLDARILEQVSRLDDGLEVSENHKKYLCKKLKFTANLTAFDKCMEILYAQDPEKTKKYLYEIYSVFIYLTTAYRGKDTIKNAYFPYIISKYEILKYKENTFIADFMFNLLHSKDVYCRENALKAIYSTGNSDYAADALKIIDKNLSFHHPKLICDGLFAFDGDKQELGKKLWAEFENYSADMQVNILNFLRFAGIRNDEKMYEILTNEKRNQELRFSAIRYFEKFPSDSARTAIQNFAENKEKRSWEYQAIASSALKAYPCDETTEILKNNLSSSNWYVRLNSAISCEKLGFSYTDLIHIFDGNDRYAREILRYRFDRRAAEKEVTTV